MCFEIKHNVTGPLFTPGLPHKNVAGFLLLAPVERSTVRKNSTLVRVLVWIHSLSCLILLSWNINHTGDYFLLFFFTPMTFNWTFNGIYIIRLLILPICFGFLAPTLAA